MILFLKQKMGVNFHIRKKTIPGGGGGAGGGGEKDHKNSGFVSGTLP